MKKWLYILTAAILITTGAVYAKKVLDIKYDMDNIFDFEESWFV